LTLPGQTAAGNSSSRGRQHQAQAARNANGEPPEAHATGTRPLRALLFPSPSLPFLLFPWARCSAQLSSALAASAATKLTQQQRPHCTVVRNSFLLAILMLW
jgi:hypothetical protein